MYIYNNNSESSRCFHIPQLAALPYDIYALVAEALRKKLKNK